MASSIIGFLQTEQEYWRSAKEKSEPADAEEREMGRTLHFEQTGLPSLSRRRLVSAVTRSLHCARDRRDGPSQVEARGWDEKRGRTFEHRKQSKWKSESLAKDEDELEVSTGAE